jgi:hypothetical protein
LNYESLQECEVQCKPPGDIEQKQVTTPKGKNNRNNNNRKGRKTTPVRKGVSLGML